MAALAGIRSSGGRPVSPELVREMARRAYVPGEDDEGFFLAEGVALACRRFWTTPEESEERQPVVSNDGGLAIVLDGRLDNRTELCAELGISASAARRHSDARLVLRAYEEWGETSPVRLVGDFAYAIWDAAADRLFCARDLIGVRSFFYHYDGSRMLFASQLRQLLADPNVRDSHRWDLEFFADYLVHGSSNNVRTPLRAIRKLPPAHVAVLTAEGLRTEAYWEPSDEKLLYRTDEEYAEHFLSLFREAVARKLRSRGPVFSDLSGGLDSPAVVCTAQEVLRENGASTSFQTITHVFDRASRSDERRWAAMVVDKYGLTNHRLRIDDHPPLQGMVRDARFWDEPSPQIGGSQIHRAYLSILGSHGANVLLTGLGAEAVLTSEAPEPLHLADLLREGRWGDLGRELGVWQKALDEPLHRLFLHLCLKPLLMPQRNYYLNRTRRSVPSFLDREFARQWNLQERFQRPWMPRSLRRASDQWQYERLFRATPQLQGGLLGKSIEVRYPFFHRPLIEFGLAVPWERKIDPSTRKPILRRAMRGILPEPLRTRVPKVSANHAFFLALADQWDELEPLAREPVLSDLGVLNRDEFYRTMRLARHGVVEEPASVGWTLALEAWVRSFSDPQETHLDATSEQAARFGTQG